MDFLPSLFHGLTVSNPLGTWALCQSIGTGWVRIGRRTVVGMRRRACSWPLQARANTSAAMGWNALFAVPVSARDLCCFKSERVGFYLWARSNTSTSVLPAQRSTDARPPARRHCQQPVTCRSRQAFGVQAGSGCYRAMNSGLWRW